MQKKNYKGVIVSSISLDLEVPMMAGSAIIESSIIKSTDQDVDALDFSDDSEFIITWD